VKTIMDMTHEAFVTIEAMCNSDEAPVDAFARGLACGLGLVGMADAIRAAEFEKWWAKNRGVEWLSCRNCGASTPGDFCEKCEP
jgi:hypothetical protein